MRASLILLALAALVPLAGCSPSPTINFGSSSGSTSSSGTGGSGATGSTASSGTGGVHFGSGGSGVGGGSSGTGGTTANAEVFGHSASTLYKLDPVTKVVTTVGDFSGCNGEVIDIALDKNSNMYGTTMEGDGVYKIDKTTAACTLISDNGSYPNSLSFVPAGTLDPNEEALVGYVGNQYVRIDTTTGAVSNVGNGSLGACSSSGDIVSVIGGGTYLTVTGCVGCLNSDCIVEVDPSTGALVKNIGKVGHTEVYGLAFWGGSAYGFDSFGQLFEIDLTTGMSTLIPIPNAPAGLSFYGAGSSTSVPVKPPT